METKHRTTTITLPTLALRGLVMFPNMVMHFDVGREKSVTALNAAMERDRLIFLVAQRDTATEDPGVDGLFQVGVVAKIKQLLKAKDNMVRVLVEGVYRAKLIDLVEANPFLVCETRRLPVRKPKDSPEQIEALLRTNKSLFEEYIQVVPQMPKELVASILLETEPVKFFEQIVHNMMLHYEDKQELLERGDIASRLMLLATILESETSILSLERDIYDQVKESMDKNQRDYYLREQLRIISAELGEGENVQDEAMEFVEGINEIRSLPDDSREKLLKECDRLYKMPPNSHEASVIRNYLDLCLELPWDEHTKDRLDLGHVRKVLDHDHYGMDKVKDRIIEMLAVRKLAPDVKGQIICLQGPPGVGKTSIAKSIARAMGRKYHRISLGGIRDESEIRGHRKTYIGAMPGRIITGMKTVKSKNPLILLDEIDKMGADYKGDPSAALLEMLDSEQNVEFHDHYLEIPFDLSEVLFLTTANDLSTVPAPLLDRMEVISLSSYTREEKFQIAKRHLLRKQREKNGLNGRTFRVSDEALYLLIDSYTREAGVRRLERQIASLCRKAAKEIASGETKSVAVTPERVQEWLGAKKYRPEHLEQQDEIGLVTGLAWTSVGGETMPIEAIVLEGTGKIELTGNLGNVMKESARTAISYVRSVAKDYNIPEDFYKTKDIHIHVPEGAVPKDGPSAGLALVTAIVSALMQIPVRRDIAMTGEVTLRGRALAIGGLKEKTMAAYRYGVSTVLIPKQNEPDLEEVDAVVLESVTFVCVESARDVLDIALVHKKTGAKKLKPKAVPPELTQGAENIAVPC